MHHLQDSVQSIGEVHPLDKRTTSFQPPTLAPQRPKSQAESQETLSRGTDRGSQATSLMPLKGSQYPFGSPVGDESQYDLFRGVNITTQLQKRPSGIGKPMLSLHL